MDNELKQWRKQFVKEGLYELSEDYITTIDEIKSDNTKELDSVLFQIANNIENGKFGFHRSLSRAYIWYIISAYRGFEKSQMRIGDLFADDNTYELCNGIEEHMYYSIVLDLLGGIDVLPEKISYSTVITEDDCLGACEWYEMSAKQGNPIAMYKMFNTMPFQNKKWLIQSSKNGYDEASYTLHILNGNTIDGMKYLARAAIQGHKEAKKTIENRNWKDNNKDFIEFAETIRRAVIEEQEDSIIYLGDSFLFGRHTEKDYDEAASWYRWGAKLGSKEAMKKLADCYYCGLGVECDFEKASQWTRRAKGFLCKDDVLYVHRGTIKCMRDHHNVEQVKVNIETKMGKPIRLSANLCKQCRKVFISDKTYEHYRKKYGPLLCRIRFVSDGVYTKGSNRNTKSILNINGYNVGMKSNLSDTQRQAIIKECIDENILSQSEIVSFLEYLIEFNGSKRENWLAVQKWERDLEFTLEYNMDDRIEVFVKEVKKYK